MVTVQTRDRVLLGKNVYNVVADVEKKEDADMSSVYERFPHRREDDVLIAESAVQMKSVLLGVLNAGYVGLIDFMGSDDRIVQAARVSYGQGTVKVREDRGLIRYLMRHEHTTPFEMVEIAFIAKMPISTARQWIRHRTANVNEYSLRYSEATDEVYIPSAERIKGQGKRNKQGSEGEVPPEAKERFRAGLSKGAEDAFAVYQTGLTDGIARETARHGLPLGTYTKWHWKIDLHNLFHFLGLRLDTHAQWEIRQYAIPMLELARLVAPAACEAFEDFALNATKLSSKEQDAFSLILRGRGFEEACELAGLELIRPDGKPMTTGEGVEFKEKLAHIRMRADNLLRAAD
jgi:thymidylate synthase (FAD)